MAALFERLCSLARYPDFIGCDEFDTVWELKHRLGFRVEDQSLLRCQILKLRRENAAVRLDDQSAHVSRKYRQEILRIDPHDRSRRFDRLSGRPGRRCSRPSTCTRRHFRLSKTFGPCLLSLPSPFHSRQLCNSSSPGSATSNPVDGMYLQP